MKSALKNYVAIILDKSGSMSSIREEAINHFNEQLQVLKEESNSPKEVAKQLLKGGNPGGLETKVTFVTFNQRIYMQFFNEEVNSLSELRSKDYSPEGMTALYDAMGFTIHKFLNEIPDINDPNVSVLFTVITDGMENASTDYNGEEGRKKLKSQIEDLQGTGRWTFTYLGADQDVLKQAVADLSIPAGNALAWVASAAGMESATVAQTAGIRAYYAWRRLGKTAIDNFYDNDNIIKTNVSMKTDKIWTENQT